MNHLPGYPGGSKLSIEHALLPVLRRTLQLGEGPNWLLSVVRLLNVNVAPRTDWTNADERMTRTLARVTARLLFAGGQTDGVSREMTETVCGD